MQFGFLSSDSAQFVPGDIIWYPKAVHSICSSVCLFYISDSDSLLLVYKNEVIWNEGVFCLSAPVCAQRSTAEDTGVWEMLIPAWSQDLCDTIAAGRELARSSEGYILFSVWALEKKSGSIYFKWADNSKPGVSNHLSVYVKLVFILRVMWHCQLNDWFPNQTCFKSSNPQRFTRVRDESCSAKQRGRRGNSL